MRVTWLGIGSLNIWLAISRSQRPKCACTNLFFRNSHVVLYIREHGGLNKVPLVTNLSSSDQKVRSFFVSAVYQRHDLVELFLVHLEILAMLLNHKLAHSGRKSSTVENARFNLVLIHVLS